jgi:hypothetical protein
MDFNELDKTIKELDNCGDEYCGNIITSAELKEEGDKFLGCAMKKCKSQKIPETEKEHKSQRKNYDRCFTKLKRGSAYYKKLTQRKKCEDKKCGIYQLNVVKKATGENPKEKPINQNPKE